MAGEIRIQPGSRDEFFEAVAPMVTATLQEEGCRAYAFTPDPNDERLIRLYELWDDEPALAAHRTSSHMAEWRRRSAELPITGRDLHLFTIADVRPL